MHFVDALPRLQATRSLALVHVAPDISCPLRLGGLQTSNHFLEGLASSSWVGWHARSSTGMVLVGAGHYWHQVFELDVSIPTTHADAEARRCAIEPRVIPCPQNAAQSGACPTGWQPHGLGQPFAHQKRCTWIHSIIPWKAMLALVFTPTTFASVREVPRTSGLQK